MAQPSLYLTIWFLKNCNLLINWVQWASPEETVSIITKNSDDKEFTGKIVFDTLMMIGTISAAWQMLLSVERASSAFKNNTSSSEFLKEKTETAKHYLDFIMPRYLSNFSTISAFTN